MTTTINENIALISEIKSHLSSTDQEQLLKPEGLLLRQRLQKLCRTVLLSNLEAALDQKAETDLWNFAFKAQITAIQNSMKGKASSNTRRAELQADLSMFLENALGFYMQLLEDVCDVFHLHPVFRRKHSSFGIIQCRSEVSRKMRIRFPSKSSSLYICQYCLVHLGDISRYLQRIPLAENFYNLAARYVPSNGQPYNQLAILCSMRTNKLAVAYYHIRSIAVRSPFPVAPTNLHRLYTKLMKDSDINSYLKKGKWTGNDVLTAFLYFIAFIHLETKKEKASRLCTLLIKNLSSQSAFAMISSQNLHYLFTITMYTLSHVDDIPNDESSKTDEEKSYRDIILLFYVGLLDTLLGHAPKSNVREHMALPSIKLMLQWISTKEKYLSHPQVKSNRCWLSLAKTLNAIQSHCRDFELQDDGKMDSFPLPEDIELQCFLPLDEAHENLDFSLAQSNSLEPEVATRLRCSRLIELGKRIAERYPSLDLMDYKVNAKNTKFIFSAPTALKVEPSDKKITCEKNVAIQAIKASGQIGSGRSTPDLQSTLHDASAGGWPTFSTASGPLFNPHSSLGLMTPFSKLDTSVLPAKTDSVSSGLGSLLTSSTASSAKHPQGVIGSEMRQPKSVHDLLLATSDLDQQINFSASDSSILSPAAAASNSYRLFSPSSIPFDLAISTVHNSPNTNNMVTSTGAADAFGASIYSPSPSFAPPYSWTHPNSSSTFTDSNTSLSNQFSAGNVWGTNKSALSQLLEEQQKKRFNNP